MPRGREPASPPEGEAPATSQLNAQVKEEIAAEVQRQLEEEEPQPSPLRPTLRRHLSAIRPHRPPWIPPGVYSWCPVISV